MASPKPPRQVMLTIFEGPDGCGKSTLAQRFVDGKVAQRIVHHGPYLDDGVEILRRYLDPLRWPPRDARHLLFDRSWLSEPIYGAVHRKGADRLGISGRRYLERLALSCGAIVLMPETDLATCQARWLERKKLGAEYLDTHDELKQVFERYAALGTNTCLPTFLVNPDADPMVVMEQTLLERPSLNRGPGIGNWAPGAVTLLVGEQASDPGDADLPFVNPQNRADGCSFWLAWKLEEWGVSERDLYWVNALDGAKRSTDPKFLEALKPKKVVALGKIAEHWCRKTAALEKFEAIDHPQYWKRFHHREEYDQLKRIFQ